MNRLVLALAAACTVAGVVASGSPARVACTPGVIGFGGTQARVFCGPGKATAKYKGKTLQFKEGNCEKTSDYVVLNLGTLVLGDTTKKKPGYFGLVVGRFAGSGKPASKDGTYTGGVITWVHNGAGGPIIDARTLKITLKGNRSRGTFAGNAILNKTGKVSGTFSC